LFLIVLKSQTEFYFGKVESQQNGKTFLYAR
jgi:hypothetical protein